MLLCRGPRKELITVLKTQCADLQLSSQSGKQTKIPTIGMLSQLYILLVQCYVFLAGVHFVGILVPFLVVHFVGILVRFAGCTLNLVRFPGCELGCKSTHCLFSTEISSFLGSLEATSLIMLHLK